MTMRRSHWFILVFVALTAACLVPSATRESGRRLRMVVWGMPFENALFRDGYAREFEQMNPGLAVRYEKYLFVTDKYFAWHILGEGADVMRIAITDYPALVAKGILEPIDGFLDDPDHGLSGADRRDFMPAIWDALLVDGRRYALPSDNAQYGLYYNKAIFDRYNAAHPDDPIGYPDDTWTWEDLRDASQRLTIREESGHFVQFGMDFDPWAWPFMAFLRQAGGELWDEAQTTTRINSPEGVEALQLLVDLLPHGTAMRAADVKDSATGPDKLFVTGQTAMMLDGSWRAPFLELIDEELDYAIGPLPRHRRKAVVCGSVLWGISVHSREKETAWRMIRWMTGFEQSLRYWNRLRVAPPARLSVIRSEAFRETDRIIDDGGTVLAPGMTPGEWEDRGAWLLDAITPDPETGELPGFVPVAPYQKDLEEKINSAINRALAPGRTQSLQALLDEAAADLHRIIDRDRRARGLPPVARP